MRALPSRFARSASARAAAHARRLGHVREPASGFASSLDTLAFRQCANRPLNIIPFVIDSLGQRTLGPVTVLNVTTQTAINSTPVVTFSHSPRVEVNDTIHIEATDQTGITAFGYEIRRSVNGNVEAADSVTSNGNITSQLKTFDMRLPYTTFPTTIYVRAFARNSNGVRAYAKLLWSRSCRHRDGCRRSTKPLPGGVMSLMPCIIQGRTDSTSRTSSATSSRCSALPIRLSRRRSSSAQGRGNHRVAAEPFGSDVRYSARRKLGRTDVSYVNLNASGSGREVYRYQLPNIVVFTVRRSAAQQASSSGAYTLRLLGSPAIPGATCKGLGFDCGDVVRRTRQRRLKAVRAV